MATIIIKNSTGSNAVPSSLLQGELAINTVTGKLYYGSGSANDVKEFAGSTTVNTGSLVTTSSFNSYTSSINLFTSSYNTGSFSGSFTGSFLGTSSWATSASQALTSSYVVTAQTSSVVILSPIVPSTAYIVGTSTTGGGGLTLNNNIFSYTTATSTINATSSWANSASQAISSSRATTSSFASTASFLLGSVTSASYADTASFLLGSVTSASYAATASIASNVTNGVSFVGSGSIITGSVAISSSYGLYVPANTFTVGDIVKVQGVFTKPNAASSMNFYIYINTSNSLSGATQLALYQTTTQRWNPITRTLAIESSTSTTLHPTNISHYNDDIVLTTATARASVNINWAADQYLLFAAQNATTGDRTDTFRFYAKRI